ncbi:hypothetical protein KY495_18195 [Massilia sp. PAMC28688]|uniref:hypothetical protein n=1 Tax=Massilia sp. PAMC28688 TaxID=2861283 RepID=UPI001C62FB82|nr:hypothetical protein [Massilia sp. PAMC28688]QYF92649.1 hypothetical protein KY495_18195 [Massilia sp. PAMC28688]
MNRRTDQKTAELVDIAVLTRAAFQQHAAQRYAGEAGLPDSLTQEIFSRPPGKIRKPSAAVYDGAIPDRRRAARG